MVNIFKSKLKEYKDFFSNNVYRFQAFDFDSTKNLFKTGVNRIGGLMENGKADKKFMFYMIVGLVVGFFVLYKTFSLFQS
jgi:hypothetical protein